MAEALDRNVVVMIVVRLARQVGVAATRNLLTVRALPLMMMMLNDSDEMRDEPKMNLDERCELVYHSYGCGKSPPQGKLLPVVNGEEHF
eukprot:scaffold75397_cov67-Cyclotella_meneghiniana.AAC.4